MVVQLNDELLNSLINFYDCDILNARFWDSGLSEGQSLGSRFI